VKPVASKPVVTTVTAKIDVGFGNALYVRGEGPGLKWDQGALMTCVGEDAWAITLGESSRAFTLKFLINDVTWSAGPDFHVASGQKRHVLAWLLTSRAGGRVLGHGPG